jgi:hypothetical protein
LGAKFSKLLRNLWVKMCASTECKTDVSIMLTVKNGSDTHIVNYEIKLNWTCIALWDFIYDHLFNCDGNYLYLVIANKNLINLNKNYA